MSDAFEHPARHADEDADCRAALDFTPFALLRARFGLSVSELATLLQVSEDVLREWLRLGVPADVTRVVTDYEGIGRILADVAAKRRGMVVQLARVPLDELRGRSILAALAAGERERVHEVVEAMNERHRVRRSS